MFIVNGFGISDRISGSATRSIEIAKGLQRRGHEIHILTTIGGFKAYKKEKLNAEYYILPSASIWKKEETSWVDRFLSYIISTIAFPLIISKLPKVEVIYTDTDYLCDVIPAVIYKLKHKSKRKNSEVKWLASTYHLIPHPSRRPGGYKLSNLLSYIGQQLSLKIIKKWGDLINTETNFLKNELVKEYRISPKKMVVIQSGISPKVIDKVAWDGYKIYDACFLAGLRPSKGIFDLIKAWKNVCAYDKNAKLVIAGGGLAWIVNKLKKEIESLDLENNVDVLGFVSEKGKYRLFKASKVYVLPSYEEGIPITFYEAMYCGLPVITYCLPTYADIENYLVGVSLGNVEKLSEEIIRVLKNEDLARRLGDKGRSLAKEHTWDKVVDCIISQIKEKD